MPVIPEFVNRFYLAVFILLAAGSCSKKDQDANAHSGAAEITSFNLSAGQHTEITSGTNSTVLIRLPDSITDGSELVADFTLSPGASASINGVMQQSGKSKNNFEVDLSYLVTAADNRTTKSWSVIVSNTSFSMPWGLGHFIHKMVSNNTSYNWYIDQATSGNFANINCGPASATMAIKWADPAFDKSALDARMKYESSGGWWSTNDINAYLGDNEISHAMIGLSPNADSTRNILEHQLDHSQIIILCLDMDLVSNGQASPSRVDKFYSTTPGWGHFIVLKGYRVVDNEVFFEAYDPYSFGLLNDDQTLKGMNRYYRYKDLAAATNSWWQYAFVVAKKGENLSLDAVRRTLDPQRVPVAHSSTPIF
jgi:hypothetical protein